MNKKTQIELTRALLDNLSIADIEAILLEKKKRSESSQTKTTNKVEKIRALCRDRAKEKALSS